MIGEGSTNANLINRLIWYAFITVGLTVFYYVLLMQGFSYVIVIVVGTFLSLFVLWIANIIAAKQQVVNQSQDVRNASLLTFIILCGVVLRVGWVYLVPPVQLSDFLRYWNAARQLLETGYYFNINGENVLSAWVPPGYPFFLAAWMYIFGEQAWLPMVINVCLYILTSIVVYSVASKLAGGRAALLAVLFLALWPSDVTMVGFAGTESLAFLLLMTGFWAFTMAYQRNNWRYAVITGLLAGYGTMVRPSILLLPVLWILFAVMCRREKSEKIKLIAIPVAAMILTIMPWTIRNYYVLGEPVLVSTSGGEVFYKANNPLATGTWTPRGEIDLDIYLHDEVLWNRMGYKLGKKWIMENPKKFIILAIKKQANLLGKDSNGVYSSLYRVHNYTGPIYYVLLQISNIWWLSIWILAIIGTIRARQFFINSSIGALLLLMILYFVAIHSVFESQPRYHMPFIGVLAIISSLAIYPFTDRVKINQNQL